MVPIQLRHPAHEYLARRARSVSADEVHPTKQNAACKRGLHSNLSEHSTHLPPGFSFLSRHSNAGHCDIFGHALATILRKQAKHETHQSSALDRNRVTDTLRLRIAFAPCEFTISCWSTVKASTLAKVVEHAQHLTLTRASAKSLSIFVTCCLRVS